jgi:hypothetical protein
MKLFGTILMLISAGSLILWTAYFQLTDLELSGEFMLLSHSKFYIISLVGFLAGLIMYDNLL